MPALYGKAGKYSLSLDHLEKAAHIPKYRRKMAVGEIHSDYQKTANHLNWC